MIDNLLTDKYNFYNKLNFTLIIMSIVVMLFDYYTTSFALLNGMHELNPIMNFIVNDPFRFAFIKLFGLVLIIHFGKSINDTLHLYNNKYKNVVPTATLALTFIITLSAVINNFLVIRSVL